MGQHFARGWSEASRFFFEASNLKRLGIENEGTAMMQRAATTGQRDVSATRPRPARAAPLRIPCACRQRGGAAGPGARGLVYLAVGLVLLTAMSRSAMAEEDGPKAWLAQARLALKHDDADRAVKLASRVLDVEADNTAALGIRAMAQEKLRHYKKAIADWNRFLEQEPNNATAYDLRGNAYFKQADIERAIADFDRSIGLRPETAAGHWRRGIALYYAGRFDAGRRQFEAYQTVDDNDVENAVWQYLCIAAEHGVATAREKMMRIGHDRRPVMMTIDALFRGKASPRDVLAAANAGDVPAAQRRQRLFYAHLYLGLYYESLDDEDKSRAHIHRAVHDYEVDGFMWHVARVHETLRSAAARSGSAADAPAR